MDVIYPSCRSSDVPDNVPDEFQIDKIKHNFLLPEKVTDRTLSLGLVFYHIHLTPYARILAGTLMA
jgi:hypothetical protein